jgi:surface carbohydrate biosynthesis protein
MQAIAYLALEIKQRELDSRLLIAAHLVHAGLPVMFGQQWAIFRNADVLPKGLMLFKTVNRIQAVNMQNCRDCGHLVAATDEEVLVCLQEACFFEVFSEIAADNCDLFFAQSELHKTLVEQRFPSLQGKVQVSGNSRLDFLAPRGRTAYAAEAQALQDQYGDFILFNTNYGQINSIWKDLNEVIKIAAKAGLVKPEDPKSVAEYQAKLEWERRNLLEIAALIDWTLRDQPQYKVVLRPHPGERVEFWQEQFGQRPGFTIIPRSNPHPWLMAAKLVAHTSCTTGLEAVLLGKPVVNLVPIPHPTFDYVTNHVNPTFPTWRTAAAAMSAFFRENAGPIVDDRDRCQTNLRTHFPDHDEGIAAKKIADGVLHLLASRGVPAGSPVDLTFSDPGFRVFNRPATLKDKFTVTQDEVLAGLRNAASRMGLALKADVVTVDDSLFMLMPRR